jgi:biopolymer transport protein ExbB
MNFNLILQATTNLADTATIVANKATSTEIPLWEMAQKGGWIMIPLLILLLLSVYIFIERTIAIKAASKEDYFYEQNKRLYFRRKNRLCLEPLQTNKQSICKNG